MKVTETIGTFLLGSKSSLGHLYNYEMEVQVNVSPDGGTPLRDGKSNKLFSAYTDGAEVWKPIRIPWNSAGEPHYKDYDLKWNFEGHVESIGMTGWNWMRRESIYVGFDIDSVVGHKGGGLSNKELIEIEAAIREIKFAKLYRSTGGVGLHLYIFFSKPIPTATHTEHAALARSLLGPLTAKTGINFHTQTDCVGSILWIWHRKIAATKGLTLLYDGGETFPVEQVPKNWKEHVKVIKKKTGRVRLPNASKKLEDCYASTKSSKLLKGHKDVLKWMDANSKRAFGWYNDWNMMICHTIDLAECHKTLGLRGLFKTISEGTSDQNVFCFPLKDGGWVVRRYGNKVNEHTSWIVDDKGWTKCYFDTQPSFEQACLFYGGKESISDGYVFERIFLLKKVLDILKITLPDVDLLPEKHQIRMKYIDGRVIFKLPKDTKLKEEYPQNKALYHWVENKGYYSYVVRMTNVTISEETTLPDDIIRFTVTNGEASGWYTNIENKFIGLHGNDVKRVLCDTLPEMKFKELEAMMGAFIKKPWEIVTKPFKGEYTGDREWNKNAPQIAYEPIEGKYPHWDRILSHSGADLDYAVKENEWCKNAGMTNGGDYLFYWIASMFQYPERSLPYLFFTSRKQNTGKSVIHEAITLLLKDGIGVVRANTALNEKCNGELAGAILAVCEEIDLRRKDAYDKIKDWVTGIDLNIREMYKNAYTTKNLLHFIQCANNPDYCPIFPNDTRITVIKVRELKEEIPKKILFDRLIEEAPAFVYDLLNVDIPEPPGRLAIPVLDTSIKEEIQETNTSHLERYLDNNVHYVPGAKTSWDTFIASFRTYLLNEEKSSKERGRWTNKKIAREFPISERFPKGRFGGENKIHIGNLLVVPPDGETIYTGKFVVSGRDRIKIKRKK